MSNGISGIEEPENQNRYLDTVEVTDSSSVRPTSFQPLTPIKAELRPENCPKPVRDWDHLGPRGFSRHTTHSEGGSCGLSGGEVSEPGERRDSADVNRQAAPRQKPEVQESSQREPGPSPVRGGPGIVSFFVPGIPAPGGSKRHFLNRKNGKVIITDDCARNKDWRAVVAWTAKRYCTEPLSGPLEVEVEFLLPRSKSHWRGGDPAKGLKPKAPRHPITRPDGTKLWRAAEDSLKGIAWMDDSQVVIQRVQKAYGVPGMNIRISRLEATV